MKKREIYDHLADIYLSTPAKKRKTKSAQILRFKQAFFVSIAIIVLLIAISGVKIRSKVSTIALVVQPDVVKINYNLGVIKKEIYSLDLSHLDLARFKALAFSVRKANPRDIVHLRLELQSSFKEISQVYIKDVKDKWQEFRIGFNDFKGISDWSRLTRVSFAIEEWNTKEKKGVVYIDDIKFLK